jgi:hypothetical protein
VLPPTPSTVKTLFGLSGNTCAYRGCEEYLTNPAWLSVKARVAHIRGERPGSARYDPGMSDEERRAFDNLILLCPNSHTLIDDLDPDAHPVELLQQMKREHEQRTMDSGADQWCSDGELTQFAVTILAVQFGAVVMEPQDHEAARRSSSAASAEEEEAS